MTFTTNILPVGDDNEYPFDYPHGFIFDIEYFGAARELDIRTVQHICESPITWGSLKRIALDEFNSTTGAVGTAEIIGLEEVPNEICLMIFKKDIR